jgi:repressor LexA
MTKQTLQPLTLNEKRILEFITEFGESQGLSPSYEEIQNRFGYASVNSVQRYLKQLQTKGYLAANQLGQRRGLRVLASANAYKEHLILATKRVVPPKTSVTEVDGPSLSPTSIFLPLLGKVAAGKPIENSVQNESVPVPANMVRYPSKSFALIVTGSSMIDEGIHDGDTLLVQSQSTAANGQICVATVQNEATVKRFYLHSGGKMAMPQIELRPANQDLESMWYSPNEVEIRGIVVGLLRRYA